MLRYWTAGESHGRTLLALVDGFPAGLEIDFEQVNVELARRQGGYGRGGRQKLETDKLEVLTGIWQGKTLGSPLTLQVINADYKLERLKELERPRPGHADLVGAIKYLGSIRGVLERASARETAVRVAAGALARQLLRLFGIETIGYVTEIGGLAVETPSGSIEEQRQLRDSSSVYTLAPAARRRVRGVDRPGGQQWRHAGWRDGGSRRRSADRTGDAHPVGSQARWPAGPSGDGCASHQGSRDRPRLRSRPTSRLASSRSDSLRRDAKALAQPRLHAPHQQRGRPGRRHDQRPTADGPRRQEADQHAPQAARFDPHGYQGAAASATTNAATSAPYRRPA